MNKKIPIGLVVAMLCAGCSQSNPDGSSAALGAGETIAIANGDFEQPASGEEIPGWMLTQHAGVAGYKAALDHDDVAQGKSSVRFTRTEPQVYGEMMQHVDLSPYAGKTVELSAMLKSADVGPKGWKLFIVGNIPHTLFYSPGLRGTMGWQRQSVQLKVPANIGEATIGATLLDAGTGWLDDVQLRVVN